MRLLNPSPGEIIDRLTILELKITAARRKGLTSVHFEAEKVALEERLKHFDDCLVEDFYGQQDDGFLNRREKIARNRNELAAVNALLWQAEDDVRAIPAEAAFRLASLCKRIVVWNDGRAKHVFILDKLYGLEAEPEKLHQTTMVADLEI